MNGFEIFRIKKPNVPCCQLCPKDVTWCLDDPKSGMTVAKVTYHVPQCCKNA